MSQFLHVSATTVEAVRRAKQHSQESVRALAERYDVNPKTVWKMFVDQLQYFRPPMIRAGDMTVIITACRARARFHLSAAIASICRRLRPRKRYCCLYSPAGVERRITQSPSPP